MNAPSDGNCKKEKIPHRALDRPSVEDWGREEPMTLSEAAFVFWPRGPLTTKSLRTAVRDGQLAVAIVAGKLFTCPRAIKEMLVYTTRSARVPRPEGNSTEVITVLPDKTSPVITKSQDEILADFQSLNTTIGKMPRRNSRSRPVDRGSTSSLRSNCTS